MEAKIKKLVCELCNSNDFTKDNDGFFVCDFCRTKYTPEQAQGMMVEGTVRVDRSGDVENLLRLAKSASESENHQEAFDYSNKALEIDPHNKDAWFIKGKSSGWLSNLNDLRVHEMCTCFNSAIEETSEDLKENQKIQCAIEINSVCIATYNMSLRHTYKFASVDGSWEKHFSRALQIIESLNVAFELNASREPLDTTIWVASKLIEGATYEYYDSGWNTYRTGVRKLNADGSTFTRNLIEETSEKIRAFDPSYLSPRPETKSGCFVVTATMGNEFAAPVIDLREFRDVILLNYSSGKKFINWYYKNGPLLAAKIEENLTMRALFYLILVVPAHFFARVILKFKRSCS